jgi:hypothetical protein
MTNIFQPQPDWEEFAEALRSEFQEYGGVLSLLEEQRRGILQRNPDEMIASNQNIDVQMTAANRTRYEREQLQARLLEDLGLPHDTSLRGLIVAMPPATRALFEALIDGAADITEKIQNKTRQNRLLLSRAGDLTEQILLRLQPGSSGRTYSHRGLSSFKTLPRTASLNLQA